MTGDVQQEAKDEDILLLISCMIERRGPDVVGSHS